MTDETQAAWACPKDGTAMQPLGKRRRGNGWRCPACRGIFLDVEAFRQGRGGRPPMWAPVAMSVFWSVLVTVVVRKLRSRKGQTPSA